MDYFHSITDFTPKRGDLLISEPYLLDPNFERTVILLCEHDEAASFGFVLNRPSTVVFEAVVKDIDDFDERLFIGGPVQQETLHFIHRSANQISAGKAITDEVFWGGDFEQLLTLIRAKEIKKEDFRFFLGYSGWSEGQLEAELKAKSWIVYHNPTAEQIFDLEPEVLWREVLRELGGKFKMLSNYPVDPRMN